MNKYPLIGVSILAVVLLILGSLSNVVGYQTTPIIQTNAIEGIQKKCANSNDYFEIIDIYGGYGVHVTLRSILSSNLYNFTWSISITGGLLHLIHKVKQETIPIIHPYQEFNISSDIFFGLGRIEIAFTGSLENGYSLAALYQGKQFIFSTRDIYM